MIHSRRVGAAALAIFMTADVASAQVMPMPAGLPPAAGTGDPMTRDAQRILDSLRVNLPPGVTPGPVRDNAIVSLNSTTTTQINVPVGGTRTVTLPGAFDRGVLVVPEVADVILITPGRLQVLARQAGSSDVIFTNSQTGETFRGSITVSINPAPVQAAISAALPNDRIEVTAVNGTLLLKGSTRDPNSAQQALAIARRFVADQAGVISQIQVLGGQQVMLRVRVAEVNRSVIKQLGINTAFSRGNNVIGNSPGLSGFGLGSSISDINTTGGFNPLAAITEGALGANPAAAISARALGGFLTASLSALESQGLVRTLAEPNLVAITGQTASFNAGGQYPIPTVSGTNGNVGTEYRNFGVSLSFTPTVINAGSIGLQIATEVSAIGESVAFPGSNGSTVAMPIFNVRKASTSVELPSGGSIAIAGLISNELRNNLSGLPGVSRIPVLGRLFSSVDFQRRESEVVITIQAFLVDATDAGRPLVLPTDNLPTPSDADVYFLNRLTGAMNRPAVGSAPLSVRRRVGYITE